MKPNKRRTLIIGAGTVGKYILSKIKDKKSVYTPVGFLDDDIRKVGNKIDGIKVIAPVKNLQQVIKTKKIDTIIIAIPSLSSKKIRQIYTIAKKENVKEIKSVPRPYLFIDEKEFKIDVKALEDIDIEQLLGRVEIKIDQQEIKKFLKDKKILITGAGGSIGSELVRQIYFCEPLIIIGLDINENSIFWLKQKFNSYKKVKVNFMLADIRDKKKLKKIFQEYRPDIVYHAAAYKHVPIAEENPDEFIKTNVWGTYNLCYLARKYKSQKFIFISTDKAVNPAGIMGKSKAMAEEIVRSFSQNSKCEFLIVRFGNVLGSSGSVLEIFLKQLKKGGPLTITDKRMKRYFMSLPEAISLVLQSTIIGETGDILVFDMGKPVKVLQLAEELIKLHGLRPYKDVKIKLTGKRPGEKLVEELINENEIIKEKKGNIYIIKSLKKPDLKKIKKFF